MSKIVIVGRSDPQASQAKALVYAQAVASWAILFDGDRWYHVERVAVALQDSNDSVGMASLCPHGELDAPDEGPSIIGVWVHPDYRRQRIGTALVEALAAESQRLYGKKPLLTGVTVAGQALLRRVQANGIAVSGWSVGGMGELP